MGGEPRRDRRIIGDGGIDVWVGRDMQCVDLFQEGQERGGLRSGRVLMDGTGGAFWDKKRAGVEHRP